jgi:hypothetical protein
MRGLSSESEYKNDEQIDNQLRSVLFQVRKPGAPNPLDCLDGPPLPTCFNLVQDLGALDIARGRDHGMPGYNDLRRAYGLAAKSSFKDITGEATEAFPADPLINAAHPIDDPNILDVRRLFDIDGNELVGSGSAPAAPWRRSSRPTPARTCRPTCSRSPRSSEPLRRAAERACQRALPTPRQRGRRRARGAQRSGQVVPVRPSACRPLGRIVRSVTCARGGSETANRQAAAMSSGCSICARSSALGGCGR